MERRSGSIPSPSRRMFRRAPISQSEIFLPLEAGLVDIPALDLSPEAAGAIRQGRVWTGGSTQDGLYWGRDADDRPVALIEALAGTLKVVRGFNL